MLIEVKPAPFTRCDIIGFSACNFAGKRSIVRTFPGGNTKGELHTEELSSLIIRAPIGTRVILATYTGGSWEQRSWRCIDMLKGSCLLPEESGHPGVRIPDLDQLNTHGARKVDPDFQSSYPLVDRVSDGEGWTFGRILNKKLKGNVRMIMVEKQQPQDHEHLSPAQRVARSMLAHVQQHAPDQLTELAEVAKRSLENRQEQNQLSEWLKQTNG